MDDLVSQTMKTTLRVPRDLHRRLKIQAIEEGRHMESLAADAFEMYLRSTTISRRARGERH